jgi:hypothetical protein
MIIYGYKTSVFGNRSLKMKCLNCDHTNHTLVFYQRYAHIFWIPLIPFSMKKSLVECHHCKKVSHESDLAPRELHLVRSARQAEPTPWWMFSLGVVLAAVLIIGHFMPSRPTARATTSYSERV